ncbi:unnamed protein product [Paramecium sonneborni]|uniref:Uncharacterized protein n=1 Tax=Paramecium sonneborni TaxID=65129 RepID=A0A8S1Q7X9_9CILI|nr:unnamed protein product [Paramecium sonneborni]
MQIQQLNQLRITIKQKLESINQELDKIAIITQQKELLSREDEDINEKVIDLLEDSLTSYLEDFKLEINVQTIFLIIPNPESIISLKKNQELFLNSIFK